MKWNDPILEEVRKNRKELEEEGGNSFDSIHKNAIAFQEKIKGRLVTKEELKKYFYENEKAGTT